MKRKSNWPTHRGRYKGVSRAVRRKLIRGAQCALCGATDDLEVDHIQPRSAGGGDDPANLRVLCRTCHKVKTQRESRRRRWTSRATTA